MRADRSIGVSPESDQRSRISSWCATASGGVNECSAVRRARSDHGFGRTDDRE